MHKQERLDARETRANTKCISVGCMTNSFQAFAIDWPCINENWASCAGERGGKRQRQGEPNERVKSIASRNIDLHQLPSPLSFSRNIRPSRAYSVVQSSFSHPVAIISRKIKARCVCSST